MQRNLIWVIALVIIVFGLTACQKSTNFNSNSTAANTNINPNTNTAANTTATLAVGDEILVPMNFKNPRNGINLESLGWYTAVQVKSIDGTKATVEGQVLRATGEKLGPDIWVIREEPGTFQIDVPQLLIRVPKTGADRPAVTPGQIVILEPNSTNNVAGMWVGAEVVSLADNGDISYAKFQDARGDGQLSKGDVEYEYGTSLARRWVIPQAEEAEKIRNKISGRRRK
jgi:hypothetical protein